MGAAASVLLLALAPAAQAQQAGHRGEPAGATGPAPLTVGTATAVPGRMTTGVLSVPAGSDAGTDIPVMVVQGRRPGPTVAIVAGLHGTEYAGVLAVVRFARELDPATLSGTVILVPLANVASFERLTARLNPVDGKNMNRVFPGDSAGTQSERVAYYLRTRVLERSDAAIDVHGGDLDESLRHYSFVVYTGNAAQDSVSVRMALGLGYDHLIRYRMSSGDPKQAIMLATAAAVLGKPTITVEAGFAGTAQLEDVGALVDGFRGALGALGMVDAPEHTASRPVWLDKTAFVTSEHGGIFQPSVERGAYVAAGTLLGQVTNYYGADRYEVRAPVAGVVLYVRAVPAIAAGDQVAFLGVVDQQAAEAP